MDQLRSEIIESEKARADFLKWKLVIVAALGAVGLGLNGSHGAVPLVLLGIPFVCLYVDLLCNHINLRIQVIGAFIRSHRPERDGRTAHEYERYVKGQSRAFELETGALMWSTWLLAGSVGGYGVWLALGGKDLINGIPLGVSGLLGLLLSMWVTGMYKGRLKCILRQ